jgi:aminoglycoside phosphotransferase (APT) family kinase protein
VGTGLTVLLRGAELASGIGDFLEEHLGRRPVVRDLHESTAGARRLNVFLTVDDGREETHLVATILPTSAIQQNSIAAEAAVRALAHRHGVPAPALYAVCTDDRYAGGAFFLSQRVDGETIPRRVLKLVGDLGLGEQLAGQIGAACARLHAIDPALAPADLLGSGQGDPAAYALEQLELLLDELLEPRPALRLGLRWLQQNLPDRPGRPSIVHCDIRVGNLIVGPDGLRAVLDWEGARRGGDPMEDLAWPALRMWRFRADEREIGGFAGREALARAYQEAGGDFDLARFRWWKALGTLKWAVGLAGQAAAHLDGRFRSVVMAASGRRVPELEWDLLMLIRPPGARVP